MGPCQANHPQGQGASQPPAEQAVPAAPPALATPVAPAAKVNIQRSGRHSQGIPHMGDREEFNIDDVSGTDSKPDTVTSKINSMFCSFSLFAN